MTDKPCAFCKIVNKETQSEIIYEDNELYTALNDENVPGWDLESEIDYNAKPNRSKPKSAGLCKKNTAPIQRDLFAIRANSGYLQFSISGVLGSFFCDFSGKALFLGRKSILDIVEP